MAWHGDGDADADADTAWYIICHAKYPWHCLAAVVRLVMPEFLFLLPVTSSSL